MQPWKPARKIIDWTLPSQSIFARKKPLAPATMARIEAGLRKFGGRAAEPFLVILRNHQDARPLSSPVPTICTSGAHLGLCQPFLISAGGPEGQGRTPSGIGDPLRTILTSDHKALVQPFIVPMNRAQDGPRRVDTPLNTITATSNDMALCQPLVLEYYGTGDAEPVSRPLHTITTRDRFALAQFAGGAYLDIHFRMLQPHELAGAMGFPSDYYWAGNREQKVRQIGNAVHVDQADALVSAALGGGFHA
jgi:DNA (cytosine-5)-methyltransferase 1